MKGRAAIFTEKLKPLELRELELPEVDPDGLIVQITLANMSHKFPFTEINSALQLSLERKVRRAAIVMS